jgi:hypothetical protein
MAFKFGGLAGSFGSSWNGSSALQTVGAQLEGLVLAPSRVIVGLDFGTTYSGFAFALRPKPEQLAEKNDVRVYGFWDWPGQSEYIGRPYCKTTTTCLYEKVPNGLYKLRACGYPAVLQHTSFLGVAPKQYLQTGRPEDLPEGMYPQILLQKFKLQLAPQAYSLKVDCLPPGLSRKQAISDYLAEMKVTALREVRNTLGAHIKEADIQWCLTVPAIWENNEKQEMKEIAQLAGLVGQGGSPHPLLIVLEPEAAALYCTKHLAANLRGGEGLKEGDIFLIADVGGGTVDLVMQQKVGTKLNEVSRSSGGLCGGTFVDRRFEEELQKRIPCYKRFRELYPRQAFKMRAELEYQKCAFKGSGNPWLLDLPSRLVSMWEEEAPTEDGEER